MSDNKDIEKKDLEDSKKEYVKPTLISEKLNAYGAACNGQSTGGRKATTGAPGFCNTRKLQS